MNEQADNLKPLFEETVTEAELKGDDGGLKQNRETDVENLPLLEETVKGDEETAQISEQAAPVDFSQLEREAEIYTEPVDNDLSDFKELSHKEFKALLEDDRTKRAYTNTNTSVGRNKSRNNNRRGH